MLIDRRHLLLGMGATALGPARVLGAEPTIHIPIKLTDGRVLVDCQVAGQGPYPFVLDTGGTIGLLDKRLADTLKLKTIGSSVLALVTGKRPYQIFLARDVTFGGQIRQPEVAFAGVEHFRFGDGVVGSLAAGTLTAVDGELDFDALEWRIYRGEKPDRTGWTRFDRAGVHSGNKNGSAFMFADVAIGGRTFRFGLDTGMPSSTRVYRKTAEAAGLWPAPRWSPAAPGGKGRMFRAPAFSLAGATIEKVLVTMLDAPEWNVFGAGIVGLPLLRRFNIATSAADNAVFLKRNGLGPQAERYNRVGLWLDRAGSDVTVGVVGAGSPAEQAGLQLGDRLIGVDFGSLLNRMVGPVGSEIALTVERGTERRNVTLTLADYL